MNFVFHLLGALIATFQAPHPADDSVLAILDAVRLTVGVATAIGKVSQLLKSAGAAFRPPSQPNLDDAAGCREGPKKIARLEPFRSSD